MLSNILWDAWTVHPFPRRFGVFPGWAIMNRAAVNIGGWIFVGTLGTYILCLLGK